MTEEIAKASHFVALIKARSCLYDVTQPSYTRADLKVQAWREISEIIREPVRACKERWKNIRTVFFRHLRKKAAFGVKKKYYLEDALQFLIPFSKSSRNQKGIPALVGEQGLVDSDEDGIESRVQESQEIHPEVLVQTQIDEADLPKAPRRSRLFHKEDNLSIAAKRKYTDTAVEQCLVEYFEAKKACLDKSNESANERFLLSLLPDMNLMNAQQNRRLKRDILELIDKILMEDNSSN